MIRQNFGAFLCKKMIKHYLACLPLFILRRQEYFFCGSNLFIKKIFWNIIYFFDRNGLTHWTYLTFVDLKLILVFTYKDLWSLHYTRITLDSSQFFKCLNMIRSPSRVWIVIVRSRFFYWSKISLFFCLGMQQTTKEQELMYSVGKLPNQWGKFFMSLQALGWVWVFFEGF